MSKPNRETQAALEDIDWKTMCIRLLLYAQIKYGMILSNLSSPYQPQDLVQDSIAAVLRGDRKWPKGVDLYVALKRIIDSKASHILERNITTIGKQKRKMRLLSIDVFTSENAATPPPNHTELENIIYQFREDATVFRILELLKEDPKLMARDLAESLSIPIREVYNANRRLKRRIEELKQRIRRETSQPSTKKGESDV